MNRGDLNIPLVALVALQGQISANSAARMAITIVVVVVNDINIIITILLNGDKIERQAR